MEKNFNPMACYAYLANAGVSMANLDNFVAGLRRYIVNDPPVVFTPCPIVYFDALNRKFYVLPFLCLSVPQNKVWGICVGSLFIKSGFNGPMPVENVEKFLQSEQVSLFGQNGKRCLTLPTKAEMEQILSYDAGKLGNHWKTLEILKANGIFDEETHLSALKSYAIADEKQPQKVVVYESYIETVDRHYTDEKYYNRTHEPKPGEEVYALKTLRADFSVDVIGKIDTYGFPDATTAEILSVLTA